MEYFLGVAFQEVCWAGCKKFWPDSTTKFKFSSPNCDRHIHLYNYQSRSPFCHMSCYFSIILCRLFCFPMEKLYQIIVLGFLLGWFYSFSVVLFYVEIEIGLHCFLENLSRMILKFAMMTIFSTRSAFLHRSYWLEKTIVLTIQRWCAGTGFEVRRSNSMDGHLLVNL